MKREKLLLVLRSRPFPFHLSGRENAERGMWESDEHRTKNFSQSLVMTFISKKRTKEKIGRTSQTAESGKYVVEPYYFLIKSKLHRESESRKKPFAFYVENNEKKIIILIRNLI